MTHTSEVNRPSSGRLAALRRTALLDTPPEEGFDRLTRMAARLLGAPISLITLVAGDRQFFKSATGLPEPWASRRGTPLTHSFCRHVVASGEPLVVEDTRRHPLLRSSPAVRELGWLAYAGVPLVTDQGYVVGTLSVIDLMPRLWSERDVVLLQDLAGSVVTEIELRTLRAEHPPAEAGGGNGNGGPHFPDLFDEAGVAMGVASPEGRWVRVNRALCDLLGFREDELLGAPTERITHPDDRPAEREALRLLLAGECPGYTEEKRCLDHGGAPVWTLATVTLVHDDAGRPHHFVVGFQEIGDHVRVETALREGEERYRSLVDHLREVVFQTDVEGRWLLVNPAWEELTGFEAETAVGRPFLEHIHPDDREGTLARLAPLLAGEKESCLHELRLATRDGGWRWVEVRARLTLDQQGTATGTAGTLTDVTDRKRAESLALGQTRLLERIAAGEPLEDTLGAVVRFVEAHGTRMITTLMVLEPGEERLRLLAGHNLPEDYRRSIELVPVGPAHGSCGTAAYRGEPVFSPDLAADPLWEGWPQRDLALAAGLRACWSVPVFSTEGVVLGTLASYHAEPREPSVEDQAIVAIGSYLAGIAIERSRTIEALGRSNRLLQQVLETLPVGVWVIAQDGRIVFANSASQQIWGEVRGADVASFDRAWWVESSRRVPPRESAAARAVRQGETTLNELLRIERSDGARRIVLNSAVPIRGAAGEIQGAIVLNQDVTEQQAAEEALRRSEEQLRQAQKMEAVGQLAGGIAHDFNNLLTGILSYCDLVLDEVRSGDPIRGDVEQIRHAGQRAAGLTRQLLAFSRRQVLQPSVLSLNGVVTELDGMLRRLLGADVTLEAVCDPGLWYVLADPGQIEQVVINLAVNARDAMGDGGRLTIATANRVFLADAPDRPNGVRPGAYVTLSVGDTGMGMDQETQARIFEPFFTTKEPGKGTGLGLSTVYGIVQQSGGHVLVESAPGSGTTFTVYLPRHAAPEGVLPGRADRRRLPGGTETLLLVEDEAAVRSSARRLLERCGYTVLEARHGGDALRLADEAGRTIDIVLTDLVMPEMGGRELVERLRAHRPRLKVLFMSGYTEKSIAVDGVMPPDTGFVEKPFTVEQLTRRVREILDG